MKLGDLDFPVLMLADPLVPPWLSGWGGSGTGTTSQIEIAYEPGEDDGTVRGDEPVLRLQTMVRRGIRMTNGHALSVATGLQDLGRQAVSGLLLSAIPPGLEPALTRQATETAIAEAQRLGARLPGSPWSLRSMDVDGTPYALWLLTQPDGRFCLVADCGPVVLTGVGRQPDAWTWTLRAVPPAVAAQNVLVPALTDRDQRRPLRPFR